MSAELSFTDAFTYALRGARARVAHSSGRGPSELPVESWTSPADDDDHALLDLCDGPTLDVGCGPGRLTHELTLRGHRALGVDVVAEAVNLTRQRGAEAVVADVFDTVPDEGSWSTVLLADGNVGIAGDPARLLRRIREVLRPGGQAVVEVAAPGSGSSSGWSTLEVPHGRCRPFRWAFLAVDDVAAVAAAAGMVLVSAHRLSTLDDAQQARWATVLAEQP
ncbi:class I SAM-dependent methyltransferase [Nocardioides currus]|uniref:class I SAM-dependent methyltransferase n=1 Tax=Nocardioides currus TaxID=2133958 RepID=UPI001403D6AD|nr:class I SAM-dependent methyltransferase [Nocardioides currus]